MKSYFKDINLGLWLIIVVLFGCYLSRSDGTMCPRRGAILQNPSDGVCGNMEIKNKVDKLQQLNNCTVIEGYLLIMLIDGTEKSFEDYSFPMLREITDYLILFRVNGLKSLRQLFPNLAVIRGQHLFHNYALVTYEMRDLEELGLINLRVIVRGAVRLTKNTKLCYVDTIDWGRIATGVEPSAHDFRNNKEASQCANYCPQSCQTTKYNEVSAKRCWTAKDCQKNLDCSCSENTSCMDDGLCCHPYCLGGCTGVGPDKCFACQGVMVHDGKCQQKCPTGTYMFSNRRCLTDKECLNLRHRNDNQGGNKSMLLRPPEKGAVNLCVMSCPNGYTVAKEGSLKDMECVKCRGFCPKECNGTDVSSIQDAERLKGCSKINGRLIIRISGQSRVAEEFEKNLGDIREVTDAITIQRSYPLLNLHFFKSLEIIGGEQPASTDGNSLIVRDNSNLQELFPEEVMKRLKIKKGKVSFHGNRKLCKYKIDEFVSYLNLSEAPTEKDINSMTNGDLAACMKNELKLRVKMIRHNLALLEWDKVQMGDERSLLVYMINYKEIKDKNVNIHQGRDACSDEVWEVKEQRPAHEMNKKPYQLSLLTNLKPFTMYAVYVQAYTLSTASHSAMTNVETFITDPYYPSEPRELTVTVISSTELEVKWKPPKYPNGNVTHYKLAFLRQTIDSEAYVQRDYCQDPLLIQKKKVVDKVEEEKKVTNTSSSSNCCVCPKSKDELREEAIKEEIEVYFENFLQNNLHCKRHDKLPDWLNVDGYSLDALPVSSMVDKQDNISFPQLDYEKHFEDKFNETQIKYKPENYSRNMDESLIGTVEVYGLKTVIPNLEPFAEYIIEVQACHNTNTQKRVKTQLCSNRAITNGRTKSDWKLDTINETSISVVTVTNTTGEVIIKWDAPPNPNGIILMYNLFYKRAWSNQRNIVPQQDCITHAQYRLLNGYRLTRLEPGNWTFYLNAVSLAGNSSMTAEHHFLIQNPTGGDDSNYVFIITIIVVILAVIIIVLVVGWFVAKNKFRHEDMTVISQNVNYVPSGEMYIMDGWEVDRDKIKLVRELGQGSFGMVYEGTAIGIGDDPDEEIRVAVKTVNDRASFNDKREFLKEATTMKAFDCYHVVKLLGVVSHGQPALVIMELMALGDLKNYLREHRPDEQERPGVTPPRLLDILQMAGEIADGMAYLAAKKFVHRDLAARNCMVDENKTVKIGDFGMTRDIYETDYYRKGGKGMLPVRWMAPESLRDGVFTTMSDVWSYGVVMWEMVTLAAQPYQGLSNDEVVKFVSNGNIMDTPDNCPEEMAYLMQRCWNRKPKGRPTFMEIIEYLLPNLNSRFDKVSYFFNEGGGPDEGGRSSNLEPPPDDDDDEEDEIANEVDDFSENASIVEGALAPPLSDSSGHLYPGDCFQVNFSQGRDQNGVLNSKIENDSFCQVNELPEKLKGNTCHDFNLNRSFEGEDFVSDTYDDGIGSDSRSFIQGDFHSVPHTIPHSLSIPSSSPRNSDGSECAPGSGVIELQPLITNDKSPSTAPFSLPSPNSDQSKAVAAAKYPGYQRLPMGSDGHHTSPNTSQPSSSHQKTQLPSAYPLTHARMDRPVPLNQPGTSASRPSRPLGVPSTPLSSSSSPSPLLPATNAAPTNRPSLRLPVLNQPPGGGFRRVPLFNSGSRDKNSQRGSQPFQQVGDAQISSGTNNVLAENLPEADDHQPHISHSSASPLEAAVGSTSSDGSKESTKSSENYSLMNGLTNGYVRHRTANC